ncbi:hypothetical protein A11S_1666 [Micavibrio aeruginosavorus EPB]|uniref:Uncharacterized protein n=1 Tax=Micavibrio aeruginosavorus EPB TaxID=349215 RepID=M4VZ81_9BACT|nr:hypothetical protein A11S_1666 [Micavibrio aeruginosavorus EPB]
MWAQMRPQMHSQTFETNLKHQNTTVTSADSCGLCFVV